MNSSDCASDYCIYMIQQLPRGSDGCSMVSKILIHRIIHLDLSISCGRKNAHLREESIAALIN